MMTPLSLQTTLMVLAVSRWGSTDPLPTQLTFFYFCTSVFNILILAFNLLGLIWTALPPLPGLYFIFSFSQAFPKNTICLGVGHLIASTPESWDCVRFSHWLSPHFLFPSPHSWRCLPLLCLYWPLTRPSSISCFPNINHKPWSVYFLPVLAFGSQCLTTHCVVFTVYSSKMTGVEGWWFWSAGTAFSPTGCYCFCSYSFSLRME